MLTHSVDHLRVHAGHGGGVVPTLEREHLLVWLPARVAPSNPTASVATAPLQKRLWHSRLGNLGSLTTQMEGVALSVSEKLGFRETCVVCNSHVRRISRELADRNVCVFEFLGFDFCGRMSVPSLGGRRYSLCAVDFRGRFMLKLKLKLKSFTICTVCAGLHQIIPYAPAAVYGPSQLCHTGNLQFKARP
jgi:hypothetical protein